MGGWFVNKGHIYDVKIAYEERELKKIKKIKYKIKKIMINDKLKQ